MYSVKKTVESYEKKTMKRIFSTTKKLGTVMKRFFCHWLYTPVLLNTEVSTMGQKIKKKLRSGTAERLDPTVEVDCQITTYIFQILKKM